MTTTPQLCEICQGEFRPRQGKKFNIGYWVFLCSHCLNEIIMEKLREK